MTEITEELLMAYADNELNAEDRSRVKTALEADPALRERVSKHHLLKAEIDLAFNDIAEEPVPEELVSLLKRSPADNQIADLTSYRSNRNALWQRPEMTAAALAACLILGVFLGSQDFLSSPGRTGVTLSDTLAETLGSQPALTAQGSVTPVASYRNADGEFCRRFRLAAPTPQDGLACRNDRGAWSVLALVPNPDADLFRPAAERALSAVDSLTKEMVRLSTDEESMLLSD